MSFMLGLAVLTTPAYADTAQLEQARQQLESLGQQLSTLETNLSQAADDLETTKSDIATNEEEVDAATQKLTAAQAVLATRTRVNYKAGATNLLDVVLGASDFDDLVSRIYYMDKVADQDAQAIADVKTSKAELEAKQIELAGREQQQQAQLDDLSAQVASYQERVTEAQQVYNSLDEAEKAELQKAAEEEAAQATETGGTTTSYLNAAVSASEAANNGQVVSAATVTGTATKPSTSTGNSTSGSTSGSTNNSTNSNNNQSSSSAGNSSTETQKPAESTGGSQSNQNTGSTNSNNNQSSDTSGNTSTETQKPAESNKNTYDYSSGDPVAIAMQFVGKVPYVSGGTSPETGLDCSGLVKYVYGKCGVSVPRTTSSIEAWLKSRGTWTTDMSQLSYGDIVFTSAGHVGVYAGNGYIIDAPVPGRMVSYRKVWSFYGGGSPW
jgi:peptidoglycan hydrolase CwlO-like protein